MHNLWGSELAVLPAELGAVRSGSQWCWEPLKLESRCYIEVERVEKKSDGFWWVLTRAIRDGGGIRTGTRVWNELSRFVEAAVLIKPAD